MLAGKRIEDLTEENLKGLVAAQTPEGLRVDFKRELPTGSNEGTREFLVESAASSTPIVTPRSFASPSPSALASRRAWMA